MKAMILAAGRGVRMLPLTHDQPKCLLTVAGRSLIEYHLLALAKAKITQVVINVSYFAEQIKTALGSGSRYGISIKYSVEPEPLETAGGIANALPLLGPDPFIVVNSDVWTDYSFHQLPILTTDLIHLVMVNNPEHNLSGDFYLQEHRINEQHGVKLTYAGISVLHPALFINAKLGKMRLSPLIKQAIALNRVSGEHYRGVWCDIGTPERLARVNNHGVNFSR